MEVPSVTYSVIKHLREEIITGELPAGAKLNEIEMATRMGISRPPLREAFRKLEHEKLVVSIPRKATYVSDISIRDCEHVYHVRKVIECAAIDCIKEQKTRHLPMVEESLAMVEQLPESLPSHPQPQQMLRHYKIMAAFHNGLVESCENKWLFHCHEGLRASLARYQIVYLHIHGSRRASTDDHRYVLEMIKSGNFAAAKKCLIDHIDKTVIRIRDKMMTAEAPEQEDQRLRPGAGSD